MKLSCCLADRGLRITFINTESVHARLVDSLPGKGKEFGPIHMVSLSDGLTPEERKDPTKQDHAVNNNLPRELEKLIKNNESSEHGKFACVIADETLGWALDVARKMGVRHAAFFPAAAGVKAIVHHIPKLIEMGAIDENGKENLPDDAHYMLFMSKIALTIISSHSRT
ncbi:Udp-glycosyltransferase 83a1 [Thalictrum thalictroides]|uniref:Udp-glycosyltransferase 83a1 n=1 Tax=Thalictrum thalictroides TaxID=46969 RepID=A0A7J6VGW1_THATH|nr:Udp-glycosyltransferase 83a1 [Thalictrum thalictroides]